MSAIRPRAENIYSQGSLSQFDDPLRKSGCPRGFGFALGLKDNRLTFEPVTKPVNSMSPSSAALHPSPAPG
jgi:hypothetical protein